MASVIMSCVKSMSSLTYEATKEHWDEMTRTDNFEFGSPVIAKGNIIEGITAQW